MRSIALFILAIMLATLASGCIIRTRSRGRCAPGYHYDRGTCVPNHHHHHHKRHHRR